MREISNSKTQAMVYLCSVQNSSKMGLYPKRFQPNRTKYQYTNVLPEYTWPPAALKALFQMAVAKLHPHLCVSWVLGSQ